MAEGFEHLLPHLTNHKKDRHVLAAAIQTGASVIVTFNLKDFPGAALRPWKVQAVHTQDYLLTLYSINPGVVRGKLLDLAFDNGESIQDTIIHLGISVPSFSGLVLQATRKERQG